MIKWPLSGDSLQDGASELISCFINPIQHSYLVLLVGGLEHFLYFHILGIIIPTDFHIFQRG